MIKLNRILLALLVILVLIASVGMVVSADSGSGRIVSGDESPTDDVSYGDDSNTGSLDSEDDPGEDPLDEAYYDSGSGSSSNSGGSGSNDDFFSVNLASHATGNPLLILLLVLLSMCALCFRR